LLEFVGAGVDVGDVVGVVLEVCLSGHCVSDRRAIGDGKRRRDDEVGWVMNASVLWSVVFAMPWKPGVMTSPRPASDSARASSNIEC
jgi:hypothetical protein